jgi:hypothetical protein
MRKFFSLEKECPRPDLNRDARFRKPLLYPVELRGLITKGRLQNSRIKNRPKFYLGAPYSLKFYAVSS